MEAWIEDQIIEEFGEEEEGGDVGGKREGRKLELREDWWEGVPERWRRCVARFLVSFLLF
jgi:hypothetical protein